MEGTADDNGRLDAVKYWGYLFQPNKCPTEKLDRLLRGIAVAIAKHIEPNDNHNDLSPTQLATFYRSVGANYDGLFLDKPPHVVAFIFKSLGCLHSLQPSSSPDEIDSGSAPNPYSSPTVPALKPRGFVTWQTIQLLLGPAEHVPAIQNALLEYDVLDPFTGQPFPKNLPAECFPDRPDDSMLAWHESVGERLRAEAQAPAKPAGSPPGRSGRPPSGSVPQTPQDERHDADTYFARTRKPSERPPAPRSLSYRAKSAGKAIALSVSKTASPYLWGSAANDGHATHHHHQSTSSQSQGRPRRRRSDGHPHAHFEDDDLSPPEDPPPPRTRTSRTMPPPRLRHKQPSGPPPRRHSQTRYTSSQLSPTSSDDSLRRAPSPRRRPRRPRSHEIDPTPREDFEQQQHHDRPSSRPHYDRPSTAGAPAPAPGPRRYPSPRSRRHSDSRGRGSPRAADVPDRPASSYFPAEYSAKPRAPANSSRPRSDAPAYRGGAPGSPYLSPRGSGSRLRYDAAGSHVSGASSASPGFLPTPDERVASPPPPRRGSYGAVAPPLSAGAMSSPGGVPLAQSPPPPGPPDREPDEPPDRERDRKRPGLTRYVTPVDGVGGRRYPSEALWR